MRFLFKGKMVNEFETGMANQVDILVHIHHLGAFNLEEIDRFVQLPLQSQRHGQVVLRLRIGWLKPERRAKVVGRLVQFALLDSQANVLCPACKLWNTGVGANLMREAVSLMGGYGVTDLQSLKPIDEHTNFRLASVTKQFTAMAIMLLVHDGKLSYETRLTDVFPDFPDYGKAITVRNLLQHNEVGAEGEALAKVDSAAASARPWPSTGTGA
jgi:hypothetical protein